MPGLDICKEMIWKLGEKKGWGTKVSTKIYYAMIELGEAGDVWKHREDKKYLKRIGVKDVEEAVSEELIDTIFYCLHALMCLNPSLSADKIFLDKFKKNEKRNRYYVDDWTNIKSEPDYSLCGFGFWCDLVCKYPWTCKHKIKWWKDEHPEWDFNKFKKYLKDKMPLGLGNRI